MATYLKPPLHAQDEINLREIFKILIESKKLIISTILIFTITSIILFLSLKPSFKTTAKLEIGYLVGDNGDRELIESSSDLISDLKILILRNPDNKFSQNISINSFEDKVISLETTSNSGEKNENLLNEIINHINERHSNLVVLITDQRKNQISNEIDLLKYEIAFVKGKKLEENQSKILIINNNLARLAYELPAIDLEISQLKKVVIADTNNLSILKNNTNMLAKRAANSPTLEQIIFSYESKINDLNTKKYTYILEENNLNNQLKNLENATLKSDEIYTLERNNQQILENELQMLMNQTQVKTQPIKNIETKTIKAEPKLIISLGIIIGFITGIFLVFINNFIKSFRESEA
jgi:LPS O-antigen subunit length determinant protein (WzzB/FepE family)